MKFIKFLDNHCYVDISLDQLLIINSALNEICNGIDIFEFETRIGADRNQVKLLLNEINLVIDTIDLSKGAD